MWRERRASAYRLAARCAFWCSVLLKDLRDLFVSRSAPDPLVEEVSVEPTNLCNANCVFCGYQFQDRAYSQIALATVQQIAGATARAGATRIRFTPSVGEPLVHRGLEDLVAAARSTSPPLTVDLTTNGILLTPERYRRLVDAGVTSIVVSMTYPDAAEYERIFRNASYAKLIRNLEAILAVYVPGECEITLSVRTPRFAWKHHPLFTRARQAGWRVTRNVFFDDWSGRVSTLLTEHGLDARPLRTKRLPCTWIKTGPHFLVDGRATACGCRDLHGDALALGPELLADLRQSYRDGTGAAHIDAFRDGTAHEICVTCRHYTPDPRGESFRLRFDQLVADAKSAVKLGN